VKLDKKHIRLSDYIFEFLADRGVETVFLVTGGGAMHLNDALGRQSRIKYVCNHHEQASSIAAEGYARIKSRPGVLCVTSGPGGVNALNGVFGAWTDSIPMLVLSGQMKRETLLSTHGLTGKLRQLGDQEVDIISMVRGITKYAQLIEDPSSIRQHLERAWHLASSGRPGPVWLDIPVDVQATPVDPDKLDNYDPSTDPLSPKLGNISSLGSEVARRLKNAKRPVLLAGSGVRLGGAIDALLALGESMQIRSSRLGAMT
jgi:acetolactate synthase-1/2/3 large subunit